MAEFTGRKIDHMKICGRCQGMGNYKETDPATRIVRNRDCEECEGEGMKYVGPPLPAQEKKKLPEVKEPLAAAVSLKADGDAAMAKAEYAEAKALYDRALQLDGMYVAALSNRCAAEVKVGALEEAVRDATTVISLSKFGDKFHLKALLRRATALAAIKPRTVDTLDRALDDAKTLLKHQPAHPLATTMRDSIEAKLGQLRADVVTDLEGFD